MNTPGEAAPAGGPGQPLTRSRLALGGRPDFDFWRTAYSHGWCALPPFSYDPDSRTLGRTLRLAGDTIVHGQLRGTPRGVQVTLLSAQPLTPGQRQEASHQLRTCLRLEEDFRPFHREARRHPEFRWIARARAGRLLRAPTVFEDLVKMLCTTNCTWNLTVLMVSNLVASVGPRLGERYRAFPSPAEIASIPEPVLRSTIKTGYRAPFLKELAERVASGDLDPEVWRDPAIPTDELYARVLSVKGVGPYAAGNLLRLLARSDYLALDSWVRGKFAELHAGGRKVKDGAIERHYRDYGPWRGLFFWLEMTRAWHSEKFRL